MGTTKEYGLPLFFNYKEEKTDDGYETIQDFFLSWLLRCSEDKYSGKKKKLYEYAKKSMILLIYGRNNEKGEFELNEDLFKEPIKITSVKTLRQYQKIDLLAEVTLERKGVTQNYVLNIENKWYSPIREGQLENSLKIINANYADKNFTIINLVIFCDDTKLTDDVQLKCKNNGFKYLTIEDIQYYTDMKKENKIGNKTGNDLFDEYWFG